MFQLCVLTVFALAYTVHAAITPNITNGLALTPPMGWSSWNNFGDNINEGLMKETIDAMDRNGLKEAGFIYVNLDDGWQRYKGDRKDHILEADPVKFPSGIKSLADYAHGKGFKLGIYSGRSFLFLIVVVSCVTVDIFCEPCYRALLVPRRKLTLHRSRR